MVKRRTPEDPWYTAVYWEPHTLWWAPAVFLFAVIFTVSRVIGDRTTIEALTWATTLAVSYAVFGYIGWRRSRE